MTDEEVDELGPVDYLVVEFPADKADFSGAMAAELSALVGRGLVRVLDLLILKKNDDGSVEGFESHDFGDDELGELRGLEDELALLLAAERRGSRLRRSRRPRPCAPPGAHQVHQVGQRDRYRASQTPSVTVVSSASSAAASAWIGIRPLATSSPPERRTAAPNGAAHTFS